MAQNDGHKAVQSRRFKVIQGNHPKAHMRNGADATADLLVYIYRVAQKMAQFFGTP